MEVFPHEDRVSVYAVMVGMFFLLLFSSAAPAADYPKEPITIKLEGAKMPPVTFPHETHVER